MILSLLPRGRAGYIGACRCMGTVSNMMPTAPFQTINPSSHSTTSPARIRRVACNLIISPTPNLIPVP